MNNPRPLVFQNGSDVGKTTSMSKDHSLVYRERAALAVAFARLALSCGWRAGAHFTEDESQWSVLYVDLPNGEQVSWHIAPSDEDLLADLPTYTGEWNGKFTGRDATWCQMVSVTPAVKG